MSPDSASSTQLNSQYNIQRSAVFDCTGAYRYQLGRRWQKEGQEVAFVMLNPSQADHTKDDPTLRACLQFARRWGYAALSVVNLFGYRTPYPKELKQADDPVGEENDAYVLRAVEKAHIAVLAWGNEGRLLRRDRAILEQLMPHHTKLYCIQQNRSGHPRHPLYIPRSTALRKFDISS